VRTSGIDKFYLPDICRDLRRNPPLTGDEAVRLLLADDGTSYRRAVLVLRSSDSEGGSTTTVEAQATPRVMEKICGGVPPSLLATCSGGTAPVREIVCIFLRGLIEGAASAEWNLKEDLLLQGDYGVKWRVESMQLGDVNV